MSMAERRRYFRIQDRLGLRYQVLDAGETETEPTLPEGLRSDTELLVLEQQIRQGIDHLRSQSNAVAPVLDLLNQKLNRLLGSDDTSDGGFEGESVVTQMSLSACGLAFEAASPIDVGRLLLLELTLLPDYIRLNIKGLVVVRESRPADEQGHPRYLLRVEFVELEEDTQEVLIQHVLRCQTRELKQRREAQE